MGIINVNNNSFYTGSRIETETALLNKVEKMLTDGAEIIDIGAQSTRPGAEEIGTEEEIKLVIPAIELLIKAFPNIIISIDTYRAKVAENAINAGAAIVNDVSSGDDDKKMFDVIIKNKVPYILMHKQGKPKTMQQNPVYDNVVLDIMNYFIPKVEFLKQNGVADLIIDPGFGFGKTLEHNYTILKHLKDFEVFELPILVGVSRKSMIQKVLNVNTDEALNGTTALHMAALLNGANILRVHDVKEAVECVKLFNMLAN